MRRCAPVGAANSPKEPIMAVKPAPIADRVCPAWRVCWREDTKSRGCVVPSRPAERENRKTVRFEQISAIRPGVCPPLSLNAGGGGTVGGASA